MHKFVRKELIWSYTVVLDPNEHLDVIALMLEPPASCCACGEGLLVTFHWKSCCELWKSFCNMLHRVILYCLHAMTSYSYPLSRVCIFHHWWRRRRHGAFYNFVDVQICVWKITTYNFNLHKLNSDCPALLFRQDSVFSQISISYKI